MTFLALIACARGPDLLDICLRSLTKYAPEVERMVILNGTDETLVSYLTSWSVPFISNPYVEDSARDHASALEFARTMGYGKNHDVVIFVDSDVVILSASWIEWVRTHFTECPDVGVVGALHVQDPSRAHASMLAMRAHLFWGVGSLHATNVGARPWRDTAGEAQDTIVNHGWQIETLSSELLPWRYYPCASQALWAHLGSGHTEILSPATRAWCTAKALAGRRLAQKALDRDARRYTWIKTMNGRIG